MHQKKRTGAGRKEAKICLGTVQSNGGGDNVFTLKTREGQKGRREDSKVPYGGKKRSRRTRRRWGRIITKNNKNED